jgi:SAM-dependent methyltransferase
MRDVLRARLLGIAPLAWLIRQRRWLLRWRRFHREFEEFARRHDAARLALRWEDRQACLEDATPSTGFDAHYVFHTAWAARCVAALAPASHVDISSSLYFCGMLSAFVPVRYFDYRPAELGLSGLETARADLLALPFPDRSLPSLSCLHVVEHIGLGRYGEPLEPEGDLGALRELARVIAPGGSLLLAVPVGRPRVVFNAHRIYGYAQVIAAVPELVLSGFALIPDFPRVELIENADPELADAQQYGCGCFHFRRPG